MLEGQGLEQGVLEGQGLEQGVLGGTGVGARGGHGYRGNSSFMHDFTCKGFPDAVSPNHAYLFWYCVSRLRSALRGTGLEQGLSI